MSTRAKNRAKEKRKKEKRARKEATRTLYESYKRQGINTKSKRSKSKNKKSKSATTTRKKNHAGGRCGNPGCIKCYGINFNPFLVNGKPQGMPHWMYQKWMKEKTNG